MEEKSCQTLKIDREFRNLIRPLHRAEYLQLEANIMSDGDPRSSKRERYRFYRGGKRNL